MFPIKQVNDCVKRVVRNSEVTMTLGEHHDARVDNQNPFGQIKPTIFIYHINNSDNGNFCL